MNREERNGKRKSTDGFSGGLFGFIKAVLLLFAWVIIILCVITKEK